MKPLVSIILPTFNDEKTIIRVVNRILLTSYKNIELVIVDDASTDKTINTLRSEFRNIKSINIIRNVKNLGPAGTRNRGIKEAAGRYVALLETDMDIEPNWLTPLVDALENDKKLAAVQGKVLDTKMRNLVLSAGLFFVPHTFWVVFKGFVGDKDEINKSYIAGVSHQGAVFRKKVFEKIGCFDERTVYSQAEAEPNFLFWMMGYKTKFIPNSIVYHPIVKMVKKRNHKKLWYEFNFYKTPRVFLKVFSFRSIVRFLPVLLGLYLFRSFNRLIKGDIIPLLGFLIACVWNLFVLPDTLRKRFQLQSLRKVNDNQILDNIFVKDSIIDVFKKWSIPVANAQRKYQEEFLEHLYRTGFKYL
jgi:GT2 family glycosyltransferase